MQTDVQKSLDQQRDALKHLQSQYDDLRTKYSITEAELEEVNSQLSWERLQHNNSIESLKRQLKEKEVKIIKLSKESELKVIFSFNFNKFHLKFL